MIKTDSIAVDCPNPKELLTFYAGLFGQTLDDDSDFVSIGDGSAEIWFQPVEDYLPPTWPTQERGQQAHFELVTNDMPAAATLAESLGATRASQQPDDGEWIVMLDPAGHPFCLVPPFVNLPSPVADASADRPALAFGALTFDCADGWQLGQFYHQLADLEIQDVGLSAPALKAANGVLLLMQEVEDYQAPTWPTQERGQQIHIDFHTDERAAMVRRALELGATDTGEGGERFTVMLDPAGHPFCICDA